MNRSSASHKQGGHKRQITLAGAVSMGTGVMIGAGVFALMGQVAGAAKQWFPLAFVAAAAVAGLTAYSYVKLSDTYPSAGGIGMFLNKAYGVGPIAATFTMAMWASMVLNESLVARTFGTYFTKLIGIGSSTTAVVALGVGLLIFSYAANASGAGTINKIENSLSIVKIGGLIVFAVACLWVADFPADPAGSVKPAQLDGIIAGVAIALLAYKGFTTITNTGGDIVHPHRNVGRAIIISIAVVTVVYVAVALAVRGNLDLAQIAKAQNFALAEAAKPVFGGAGFKLVALLAVIATLTSVLASMFSTSRMLGMMEHMDEVPEPHLPHALRFGTTSLLVTTITAMVLTIGFDLSRIASLGAFAYLSLDAVIHWGHYRHLRPETGAHPAPLLAAVVADIVVFVGLFAYRLQTDTTVIVAFIIFAIVVGGGETWYMRRQRTA